MKKKAETRQKHPKYQHLPQIYVYKKMIHF